MIGVGVLFGGGFAESGFAAEDIGVDASLSEESAIHHAYASVGLIWRREFDRNYTLGFGIPEHDIGDTADAGIAFFTNVLFQVEQQRWV